MSLFLLDVGNKQGIDQAPSHLHTADVICQQKRTKLYIQNRKPNPTNLTYKPYPQQNVIKDRGCHPRLCQSHVLYWQESLRVLYTVRCTVHSTRTSTRTVLDFSFIVSLYVSDLPNVTKYRTVQYCTVAGGLCCLIGQLMAVQSRGTQCGVSLPYSYCTSARYEESLLQYSYLLLVLLCRIHSVIAKLRELIRINTI